MAPIHLLVLVHGMWGERRHLAECNRIIKEVQGAQPSADGIELRAIVPETNEADSTYDGIDWGAERVVRETLAEVKRLEAEGDQVVKFSITGYSLGGLISRYTIALLKQKGFFEKVEPVNFNTIATPNLGLLRYPTFVSSLYFSLGPKFLSRTGEQFYCVDKWSSSGKPLIEVMADPDQIFYKALSAFKYIQIYASAWNDRTVPYMTAAMEVEDPFFDHETSGIEITLDEKYSPVIKSYHKPLHPPVPEPKPTVLSPKWFRQKKSPDPKRRPSLPPFLQFSFPMNVVFYASLPLLIPTFLSLVLMRFALSAHSSRARIRSLEKDAAKSGGDRLIYVISQLEKRMEDAVAEAMDDPGPGGSETTLTNVAEQAILSDAQRRMAANLNKLPQLKKVVVYFPDIYNAHGIIISRDVRRFEFHRRGEGVIRHWADSFVL